MNVISRVITFAFGSEQLFRPVYKAINRYSNRMRFQRVSSFCECSLHVDLTCDLTRRSRLATRDSRLDSRSRERKYATCKPVCWRVCAPRSPPPPHPLPHPPLTPSHLSPQIHAEPVGVSARRQQLAEVCGRQQRARSTERHDELTPPRALRGLGGRCRGAGGGG